MGFRPFCFLSLWRELACLSLTHSLLNLTPQKRWLCCLTRSRRHPSVPCPITWPLLPSAILAARSFFPPFLLVLSLMSWDFSIYTKLIRTYHLSKSWKWKGREERVELWGDARPTFLPYLLSSLATFSFPVLLPWPGKNPRTWYCSLLVIYCIVVCCLCDTLNPCDPLIIWCGSGLSLYWYLLLAWFAWKFANWWFMALLLVLVWVEFGILIIYHLLVVYDFAWPILTGWFW
jgi:hypothetical protein